MGNRNRRRQEGEFLLVGSSHDGILEMLNQIKTVKYVGTSNEVSSWVVLWVGMWLWLQNVEMLG